jgi:hypothetical protein
MWPDETCLYASSALACYSLRNDDDVARLDTMCTLTMHGDEWSAKFKDWAKWMGFPFQMKPHKVTNRFGGGEKKLSAIQEVLPISIWKFR